jgi:hypothetical protein
MRRVLDKTTWEERFEPTNEPEIVIAPTGDEEVDILNRPTTKVLVTKNEISEEEKRIGAEFTIDNVP